MRPRASLRWASLALLVLSVPAAAQSVLLAYYDPFGGAPSNNSARVATEVAARLNAAGTGIVAQTCLLETKFDVAYAQLETCLRSLPQRPLMVLGLGEGNCGLKLELMAHNLDRTRGPDNAGVERRNTPIVPEGPRALGFTYPLAEMYCALTPAERRASEVSNSAGSFVCNNTAYQLSWYYPELVSGFIHVPAHNCRDLSRRTQEAVVGLERMILRGLETLRTGPELRPLPVTRAELEARRSQWRGQDACRTEFYQRARPF
jgi:pyroglutamyl-peptidase